MAIGFGPDLIGQLTTTSPIISSGTYDFTTIPSLFDPLVFIYATTKRTADPPAAPNVSITGGSFGGWSQWGSQHRVADLSSGAGRYYSVSVHILFAYSIGGPTFTLSEDSGAVWKRGWVYRFVQNEGPQAFAGTSGLNANPSSALSMTSPDSIYNRSMIGIFAAGGDVGRRTAPTFHTTEGTTQLLSGLSGTDLKPAIFWRRNVTGTFALPRFNDPDSTTGFPLPWATSSVLLGRTFADPPGRRGFGLIR
jgi:hypothetical protein